jgi:acyl-CoA oxidase
MRVQKPLFLKSPIITRKTDESHLIDEEFHLELSIQRKTTLASAASD